MASLCSRRFHHINVALRKNRRTKKGSCRRTNNFRKQILYRPKNQMRYLESPCWSVLLKAFLAVNRLAFRRFKRYFAFLLAVRARCFVHFSWSSVKTSRSISIAVSHILTLHNDQQKPIMSLTLRVLEEAERQFYTLAIPICY